MESPSFLFECVVNKAERLASQGFQGQLALFQCKASGQMSQKTLHLPLEQSGAPAEIRITTMAEFRKSGSFEPFLWNCAATAARINRFPVYSAAIIIGHPARSVNRHGATSPIRLK